MPGPASSATNVGAGSRSPSKTVAPAQQDPQSDRGKQRAVAHAVQAGPQRQRAAQGACGASTLRTHQDSKCPVPVLVMSLLFIASVFMLHIWGKYTRS